MSTSFDLSTPENPVPLEIYARIFENAPSPLAILEQEGRWVTANACLRELLGPRVASGEDWLLSVQAPDEVLLAHKAALAGTPQRQVPVVWLDAEQEIQALATLQLLDAGKEWVLLSLQVLPGSHTPGIRDSVTGLIGHALFMDRLNLALARKRRNHTELALMMLTIDNLVPLASEQGPRISDAITQVMSERLQLCVRKSDSVARLGTDSFALLFEEVGTSLEAITLAGKVFDSLRMDVVLPEGVFQMNISIGAVMARPDQDTWELVRQADQALYQAQQNGGNTYELIL